MLTMMAPHQRPCRRRRGGGGVGGGVSVNLLRHLNLLLVGLSIIFLVAAHQVHAIYPAGHFDTVTKITDKDHLDAVVQENIDAGRTLFVRWIASPG